MGTTAVASLLDVEETDDSARESTCSYMERNRYQSTPRSKGRQRRKAELLPFGAEDDLLHATTMITLTARSGAPRGRRRASARGPNSTPRCRCPPQSRSVEGKKLHFVRA